MRFISERPYLISVVLIVLVALWMSIPLPDSEENGEGGQSEKALQKVQVRSVKAESTELELIFTGRTEPNLRAEIASELDGILMSFEAARGTTVRKGDPIARIGAGSIQAALNGALAEQNSALLEYEAQTKLRARRINTENDKAVAFASLQAAKARVEQFETELSKTAVLAPFDGLVADHHAETGDFMGVGKPIATLIDLDPIRAVGDVAERNVAELTLGAKAQMTMLNGELVEGEISYISPFADETTRTFRVEITLPNASGELVAGMTTQIKVPLRTAKAHKISNSLLTLTADGDLQVATVDEQDKVVLFDVEIIRSATDGIWVTGIPDNTRLITLGQGFVYTGDLVDPVDESESSTVAATDK